MTKEQITQLVKFQEQIDRIKSNLHLLKESGDKIEQVRIHCMDKRFSYLENLKEGLAKDVLGYTIESLEEELVKLTIRINSITLCQSSENEKIVYKPITGEL